MAFRWLVSLISFSASFSTHATINVTSLNENGIQRWENKIFSGQSTYQVVEYKNHVALKAESDQSASGLILKQRIDLHKTPYLNWSWLTEQQLLGLDEQNKEGDDYVARIYVVIDGGLLPWRTKSLNYVWSSNQNQGQVWDNAFAGSNVKMIAVRGKEAQTGQWYSEKRHVYKDFIEYFGDKGSEQLNLNAYQYIDIIAIMTDTDNSGLKAESYYGDILFSERTDR